MIGLQPFQRRVGRPLDRFRRKILWDLALTAAARFAVMDEIVSDLGRDRDFIPLFRERLGDQLLAQSVAISVRRIEQGDAEIERLVHERNRFAFGEVSPPAGRDGPQAEANFAYGEVGIFVSAEPHRQKTKRSTLNAQHPTFNEFVIPSGVACRAVAMAKAGGISYF